MSKPTQEIGAEDERSMSTYDPSKVSQAVPYFTKTSNPMFNNTDPNPIAKPSEVLERLSWVKSENRKQRSQECCEEYQQLFEEWKSLSLNASMDWVDDIRTKLGKDGDAEDFFDWIEDRPDSPKPEFDALPPKWFGEILSKANWGEGNEASQVIFGRLWYGRVRDDQDLALGWIDLSRQYFLALRLNGHLVNPKLSDPATCRDLKVQTLLPHTFIALQYSPDGAEVSLVTQFILVLGNVVATASATSLTQKITRYILAMELKDTNNNFWADQNFFLIRDSGRLESTDELSDLGMNEFTVALLVTQDGGRFYPDWIQTFEEWDKNKFRIPRPPSTFSLRSLSFKEPEFFEVGHLPTTPRYIAMIPST